MTTRCKLCGLEGELRNSHIIPEFVYRPLYDTKHRFHVLSNLSDKGPALIQKGVREPLLCGACEQALGVFERYASLVFSGQTRVRSRREGKLVHLEGLDYAKFKLFALSILWRSGVSSLDLFRQVDLGPHETPLREMLLASDPGPPDVYPFMMSPVVFDEEVQGDFILQPTWTRSEGHKGYRFVFGGIAWIYLVSSHRAPGVFRAATLSLEGRTTMLISDVREMSFVMDLMREIADADNIPEPTR